MLATFLTTLALAGTAQTAPDDTSVRIPGYQIQLPEQPYRLMPGDFNDFKGAYDMSNGDTMVLRQYGRKLFAEIGDGPRTEIVPAARNEFVSVDEQLKMTLNRNVDGLVKGELLMALPRQTMGQAGGAGVTVTLLGL
ncbi:hypothetical protein [Massilia eurypsychrophila]|uniref:hypothetical protein n=1 Tax=Massilia eurypsychrophila TaxID=1485217 RepID=UPI0010347896|nr:hypothetical protein [Massilia eurypsychrophila]